MNYRDNPYVVTRREDYEALKKRGIDILFWNKNLVLEHGLRLEIQRDIFGKGNTEKSNIKFYKYAWSHKDYHVCENCRKHLLNYSATYVSHILSRGAHPETAYDLRNFNILCKECHDKWENPLTREGMNIYNRNKAIIKTLLKEYGQD